MSEQLWQLVAVPILNKLLQIAVERLYQRLTDKGVCCVCHYPKQQPPLNFEAGSLNHYYTDLQAERLCWECGGDFGRLLGRIFQPKSSGHFYFKEIK